MATGERQLQGEQRQRRGIGPHIKQCMRLWDSLEQHEFGFFFRWPVNPYRLGLEDYWQVVPQPIDLATIAHKLRTNRYRSPAEFDADVNLMLANAQRYNEGNCEVMARIGEFAHFYAQEYSKMKERFQRETLVDERKGRIFGKTTRSQKLEELRRKFFTEERLVKLGGFLSSISEAGRKQIRKIMSKKYPAFSLTEENLALEKLPTEQLVSLVSLTRQFKNEIEAQKPTSRSRTTPASGRSRRLEEEEESSFEIEDD